MPGGFDALLDGFRDPTGAIGWPALAATITLVGALVVFMLTRLTDAVGGWLDRRRRRAAFIRALFAEIDFNARELRVFNSAPPTAEFLTEALDRDPGKVPHITDARHTIIYRESVDDLGVIDDGLLGRVVEFYGELEKLKVQIDGLQLASYRTISTEGKVRTVLEIYDTSRRAAATGFELMNLMARAYRRLGLRSRGATAATVAAVRA